MNLTEIIHKINLEMSENYDKLVLSMLSHFGITTENMFDQSDRVLIVHTGKSNQHFYIDGVYGFSIIDKSELIFDDTSQKLKANFLYEVEVIESMIGGNYEKNIISSGYAE